MKNSINTVAGYIIDSAKSDALLAGLQISAGVSLTRAALATYDVLYVQEVPVQAKELAGLLGDYGNKDTVARLAEVGRFLSLSGDYAPDGGVSIAHTVRNLIIRSMKSVGLPATRKSIIDAGTQPKAASALAANAKVVKAVAAVEPDKGESNEGETSDTTVDAFTLAVAKVVKALESAMSSSPVTVTDAHRIEWAKVTDAVTLLDRKIVKVDETETVDA